MAIPLTPADDPAQRRPMRARRSIAGLRVLVAEDQEMVRDLITVLLTREKASVTSVTDGAAALEIVQAQDFDVILMDMRMPVMSGFEATKRIRQLDGPVAHIPILALTASVQKAEIAQCLRAGMDGHVPKPFTTDALTMAISQVLFED